MLLEILANFKGATPFKEIVLDDKWDQINRCYMFLLCVIFGTVGGLKKQKNVNTFLTSNNFGNCGFIVELNQR